VLDEEDASGWKYSHVERQVEFLFSSYIRDVLSESGERNSFVCMMIEGWKKYVY